jgi:predicted ABC-type transport system involved in lysophospholipase L1 biosynthesis ATPase subunit
MLFGEAREEVGSGSAGDALVEANDLEKTYAAGGARVHGLRGVDLSIFRGEMVAVMGPPAAARPRYSIASLAWTSSTGVIPRAFE